MPHVQVPIEDGPDDEPIGVGDEEIDWDEIGEAERERTRSLFDDPPVDPDTGE
jgi:hypothetical protein